MRTRTTVLIGTAVAAAVALSPLAATAAAKKITKKAVSASLKGICPDKIVIQTDWFPESEHGALYQLLGSDYKVDTGKKIVSGSLINSKGASCWLG